MTRNDLDTLTAAFTELGIDGSVAALAASFQRIEDRAAARQEASVARTRAAVAAARAADAGFAEFIAAGFTAADLQSEYPAAYQRHLNAVWRAKQG